MKKIKVMSVFGTRPEATKMIPIIKELDKFPELVENIVCVTAQHREMLDQIIDPLNIKADYDLNIMKKGQTLTDITTSVLEGLNKVIDEVKPDLVLVHGDTSTSFAGALACFYNKISIGHVEAGLRTYEMYEPFPEEMNRVLTGHMATLHFSPTRQSKENLLKENISKNIFITGNTSLDFLKETIKDNYVFSVDTLNHLDYKNHKVIVMTAHRRENLGEPLENICKAMLRVVEENPDTILIYAVHLNPLVQETAKKFLGNHSRIYLVDPLDVFDMHNLMNKAYIMATDSGGLQEEVTGVNIPALVLRNVTERPEGVEAGRLKLVGSDVEKIVSSMNELLQNKSSYQAMLKGKSPFGDGNASERIVNVILYNYGLTTEKPVDYFI
ncbi:MAG: non-hydrolyzing UDP-N-acetylglucosamine 2-epimerase [Lachnospirales bacterium]